MKGLLDDAGPPLKAEAGMTPLLSVTDVSYAFEDGKTVLEGLSFSVFPGEFVCFLAPSGMGKSTLFRLIAGLLQPQAGTIALASGMDGGAHAAEAGGRPGSAAAAARERIGRVAYMPQRDCLMPWRTVLDNAVLGLELAGVPKREARRRAKELLPSFGLAGTEAKYPHELSGGMRQRVSFLRSVLTGADILLLDEPFSALDALTRIGMQEWLTGVWEAHRKTVLFITHDVDEALLLSDRVLIASESPIRRLAELRVELRRPRRYADTTEPEFNALKKEALVLLRRGANGGGAL